MGIRKLFLIATLCLLLPLQATAGYLIVNNDEWTLSNTGFTNSPTTDVFINNITNLFTGDQPGDFLAYSANFGLGQSDLANAMTAAGHDWTVSTADPFNLTTLSAYDGVFLGGHVGGGYLPTQPVIDYLQGGGNVYIMAGTGNGGSAAEAAAWNPILATAGLQYQGSYNGVSSSVAPDDPSHPLLAGVSDLYFYFGNSVLDLDTTGTNGEILFTSGGQGMLALGSFGTLPPPSQYSPIPEPSTALLLMTGLAAFGYRSRKKV